MPAAETQTVLELDVPMRMAEHSELEELKRELRDALRRETATGEVLKLIGQSRFDLQKVLDTLVESVTRLCDANHGWLFQREGECFHWVAGYGHEPDVRARLREFFEGLKVPIDRGSVTGRAALEARAITVSDVLDDPEYTWGKAQEIGRYRAALGAPLLRNGDVVGMIFVGKTIPQPFTSKQIALVEGFADQAVIAIENARFLPRCSHGRFNWRIARASCRKHCSNSARRPKSSM